MMENLELDFLIGITPALASKLGRYYICSVLSRTMFKLPEREGLLMEVAHGS
jgi:hypothetical protein